MLTMLCQPRNHAHAHAPFPNFTSSCDELRFSELGSWDLSNFKQLGIFGSCALGKLPKKSTFQLRKFYIFVYVKTLDKIKILCYNIYRK